MKTQQTISLKLDGKYLPSDIQATRNSVKKSKSLQKMNSKDSVSMISVDCLGWYWRSTTKLSTKMIYQDIQIKYFEIMSRIIQYQKRDYKKEIPA